MKNKVDLKELETKILIANLKKTHYLYNQTIDKLNYHSSQIGHKNEIENDLIEILEQIDQVKENIINHKVYVDTENIDNDEILDLKVVVESIYQTCWEFNSIIKKIETNVNNIFANDKEKLKQTFQEIIDLIKQLKVDVEKINVIEPEVDENQEEPEEKTGYYSRFKNWVYSYWK